MSVKQENVPRVELEFFAGSTPPLKFTVKDDAGSTMNLEGWTVKIFALVGEFEGSGAYWNHTLVPADQDDEEGVARYTLTATDTAWITPSTARLQLHYFVVRAINGAVNRAVLCGTIGIKRGEI